MEGNAIFVHKKESAEGIKVVNFHSERELAEIFRYGECTTVSVHPVRKETDWVEGLKEIGITRPLCLVYPSHGNFGMPHLLFGEENGKRYFTLSGCTNLWENGSSAILCAYEGGTQCGPLTAEEMQKFLAYTEGDKEIKTLYEKIVQTPDLSGEFELRPSSILWRRKGDLYAVIHGNGIVFYLCKQRNKVIAEWKIKNGEEAMERIKSIGERGNIVVLFANGKVCYQGTAREYKKKISPKKKYVFGT